MHLFCDANSMGSTREYFSREEQALKRHFYEYMKHGDKAVFYSYYVVQLLRLVKESALFVTPIQNANCDLYITPLM